MAPYAVIEAPSTLGLFPRGVEGLPAALIEAGLLESLHARHAGIVATPPYQPHIDPEIGVRNAVGIRRHAEALAGQVGEVLDAGDTPIVLGGDCSIILGILLALHGRGRFGLLFIDGHADFYQPAAEPDGQAASMDLALATGRGPSELTELGGTGPLLLDLDVVQFGRRDAHEAAEYGSQRIEDTAITVVDLHRIRAHGIDRAVDDALQRLVRPDLDGFWVHLDCDVVDDDLMPAVDYRLAGGLSWRELEDVLRRAADTGHLGGVDVTIFNPSLDPDGSIARELVGCLRGGLGATT